MFCHALLSTTVEGRILRFLIYLENILSEIGHMLCEGTLKVLVSDEWDHNMQVTSAKMRYNQIRTYNRTIIVATSFKFMETASNGR